MGRMAALRLRPHGHRSSAPGHPASCWRPRGDCGFRRNEAGRRTGHLTSQLERHHFLALLAQAFDTEGHHVEKHFLDFEEPYRLQR